MKEKIFIKNIIEGVIGGPLIDVEAPGLCGLLSTGSKVKVNIMALGDVGTNVLMGLKLLGEDVIEEIGIYDIDHNHLERLEMEFNQMRFPPAGADNCELPRVVIKSSEELLDCHVLIFCASKGVPELGSTGDVRMAQLEANMELVQGLGDQLRTRGFGGLVCVVSDPVDQLCLGLLRSSGLHPGQIRGFGLGVMAARAAYYAEKDEKFSSYLKEGRAYGPHGEKLIIANSIENYDEGISKELTELTVRANMKVRDLGYKPFLAPAISSAALSILYTLRGEWNYGSVYMGTDETDGGYLGILSRLNEDLVEFEDREVTTKLAERIEEAFRSVL